MDIKKTNSGEKIVFSLLGRLDTNTAPLLQDELLPAFNDAAKIELDFSNLVYVSSAGLRVLLLGQKTAKSKGASMIISGVSSEIAEVFDMTGFSDFLTIL